jgi:hypothetical protein
LGTISRKRGSALFVKKKEKQVDKNMATSADDLKARLREVYKRVEKRNKNSQVEVEAENTNLSQIKLWNKTIAIGLIVLNIAAWYTRRLDFYVYLLVLGYYLSRRVDKASVVPYTWEDARRDTLQAIDTAELQRAKEQIQENKWNLTPNDTIELEKYLSMQQSLVDTRKALSKARDSLQVEWFSAVFVLSTLHGLIGLGIFAYKYSMIVLQKNVK